jgi:hypothetical protein
MRVENAPRQHDDAIERRVNIFAFQAFSAHTGDHMENGNETRFVIGRCRPSHRLLTRNGG